MRSDSLLTFSKTTLPWAARSPYNPASRLQGRLESSSEAKRVRRARKPANDDVQRKQTEAGHFLAQLLRRHGGYKSSGTMGCLLGKQSKAGANGGRGWHRVPAAHRAMERIWRGNGF